MGGVLELLPAVDISGGYAVRPVAGRLDGASERIDPHRAALTWCRAGAQWMHLVDLDLAFGTGSNTTVLASVIAGLRQQHTHPVAIQVSGGVKDAASFERALSLEPDRINITSAALANPQWLEQTLTEHGDRIALGVDVREGTVVARGTNWVGGSLSESIAWLESVGVRRYIVTDVSRDGALTGPGLEPLKQVLELTEKPVIASGGVACLDDIRVLHHMTDRGLEGLVLGKALYAGRFTLEQALETAGYTALRTSQQHTIESTSL